MTRKEYLNQMLTVYGVVKVLSDKNGCKVLRLRHKEKGKDLVVRSYDQKVTPYCMVQKICCRNLPVVYDAVDLVDGQIVLEEYIDGLTVAQVMEGGWYKYRGAKKVMQGILQGLAALHSLGLVHRDIKPENVMVTPKGRVVLLDLNAARKVSVAPNDTVIMGTVGYASPEQLGVTQTDARTDLYAAGVLLNVMMTGDHPSKRIAKGKAGKIVRKCTHINPADRYDTAQKMADAL